MSHAVGAKVLLDACQSVPHLPVNVQALGCDWLVASGHKMCGPTGIGFLWGKYGILDASPPWQGGGEMIDEVRRKRFNFNKPNANALCISFFSSPPCVSFKNHYFCFYLFWGPGVALH